MGHRLKSLLGQIGPNIAAALLVGGSLLLQDSVLAYRLGLSAEQDFFQASYQIVSMLWNTLAGGTYLAVALPLLVLNEHKHSAAWAFERFNEFSQKLFAAICVSIVATIGVAFAMRWHPIGSPLIFATLLLTLPVQVLIAQVQAVLLRHQRAWLATAATAIAPLVLTLAGVAMDLDALTAAQALLLGVLVQLIAVMFVSSRAGTKVFLRTAAVVRPLERSVGIAARDFAMIAAASLIIGAVYWLMLFKAGHGSSGSIATLSFALRPALLIVAFLTVVLVNALLARFTSIASVGDLKRLRREISLLVGIALVAGLGVVLVWRGVDSLFYSVVLERGNFSRDNQQSVVNLNRIAMLLVPTNLVAVIAWRGLNAVEQNSYVLLCSFANLAFVVIAFKFLEVSTSAGLLWIVISGFTLWSCALYASFLYVTSSER